MWILETTVHGILLVSLAGYFVPPTKRPGVFTWLPTAAALLGTVELILEPERWLLIPAMLLALFLSAVRILRCFQRWEGQDSRYRKTLLCSGCIWLLFSFGLISLFPVVTLPTPSGPYLAGSVNVLLEDDSRHEPYSDKQEDKRRLMVKVWYPLKEPGGATPDDYARYEANNQLLPWFLTTFFAGVKSHSWLDGAVAESPEAFPVILFSHDLLGSVAEASTQVEELVSHGYVVVGISHPYDAMSTLYPDGKIVYGDVEKVKRVEERSRAVKEEQLWQEYFPEESVHSSLADFAVEALARLKDKPFANEVQIYESVFPAAFRNLSGDDKKNLVLQKKALLEQLYLQRFTPNQSVDFFARLADIRFVAGQMAVWNADKAGRFYNKLNTAKLGIFGVGRGGVAAVRACLEDKRFVAGVDLDGAPELFPEDGLMETPFMVVQSENRSLKTPVQQLFERLDCFEPDHPLLANASGDAYVIRVANSGHKNFTDWNWLPSFWRYLQSKTAIYPDIALLGKIHPRQMAETENQYVLDFFDTYLKGKHSKIQDGFHNPDLVLFKCRLAQPMQQ